MATFRTTLLGDGTSSAAIEIPAEIIDQFGAGKRPPVQLILGGHTVRTTVAVMGGRYLIAVNADVRRMTGLQGGDTVDIEIVLDNEPRSVTIPDDLDAALASHPDARQGFENLTASKQQRIVTGIEQAKTRETRGRRISRAITDLSPAVASARSE